MIDIQAAVFSEKHPRSHAEVENINDTPRSLCSRPEVCKVPLQGPSFAVQLENSLHGLWPGEQPGYTEIPQNDTQATTPHIAVSLEVMFRRRLCIYLHFHIWSTCVFRKPQYILQLFALRLPKCHSMGVIKDPARCSLEPDLRNSFPYHVPDVS